jgi:hypothetical protein
VVVVVVVVVVEGRLVWWCVPVFVKKAVPQVHVTKGPTLHNGKKGPCSLSLFFGAMTS